MIAASPCNPRAVGSQDASSVGVRGDYRAVGGYESLREDRSMRFVRSKSWALFGAALLIASATGRVEAAGFQVSEQSIVGLGRAFAGAGIVGDDLSAVFYNPAGMSLLRGTGGQAGITFVLPSARRSAAIRARMRRAPEREDPGADHDARGKNDRQVEIRHRKHIVHHDDLDPELRRRCGRAAGAQRGSRVGRRRPSPDAQLCELFLFEVFCC
jgi:hypothetical protein